MEEDDLAGKDGLGSILSRTGWHDQHWLHAALCSIGEKLRFFFFSFWNMEEKEKQFAGSQRLDIKGESLYDTIYYVSPRCLL